MENLYNVVVTVVSQKGECHTGHKVGDTWVLNHDTVGGICLSAFNAILPEVNAFRSGGTFPWVQADGSLLVACPDPKNPVVFKIKRMEK